MRGAQKYALAPHCNHAGFQDEALVNGRGPADWHWRFLRLENAWETGDPGVLLLDTDNRMKPLHSEPRFVSLMGKRRGPPKC